MLSHCTHCAGCDCDASSFSAFAVVLDAAVLLFLFFFDLHEHACVILGDSSEVWVLDRPQHMTRVKAVVWVGRSEQLVVGRNIGLRLRT